MLWNYLFHILVILPIFTSVYEEGIYYIINTYQYQQVLFVKIKIIMMHPMCVRV